MVHLRDIERWIGRIKNQSYDPDAYPDVYVGIDDGGLQLVAVDDENRPITYFAIGGIPAASEDN